MGSAGSIDSKPQCPFDRMCEAQIRKAKKTRYIDGEASEFYFHCSKGDIDQVRQFLEAPDRRSIDELVKLERNGDTALHVATEKGHTEIVKLLLEHRCSRTILNRFGKIAAEEATIPEIQQLFVRSGTASRFQETDVSTAMAIYLPEENGDSSTTNETEEDEESSDYVHRFKSKKQVYEYTRNQQTTAMWVRFYNWFSGTFPSLFQRENLTLNSFDLDNNTDFKQFLEKKLTERNRKKTLDAINNARKENSIKPLITIYTNEDTGFYRSLNEQLSDSPAEADNSPHLCDRFVMEFHIRGKELADHIYRGTVYRGATITLRQLNLYEKASKTNPQGVVAFKAFTSTSTDINISLKFTKPTQLAVDRTPVLFVIEIKSNSPTIIGISDVSEYTAEKEVLIMPGNLFVVKKLNKNVGHYTEIHLEYLHIPMSVWTKLSHTIQSARKNSVMD